MSEKRKSAAPLAPRAKAEKVSGAERCRLRTSSPRPSPRLPNPVPIRFTAEDRALLRRLCERTGLTIPGVLRMAIRVMGDDSFGQALVSAISAEVEVKEGLP